jgi:predicted DsbA family dithiol-disulfide isomerase
MEPVLKVQIWSDLICPWCWIAEQRFERALSRFPHIDKVDVVFRAFRLMPGAAPSAVEETLAKKYGGDPRKLLSKMEEIAAEDGLIYRLSGTLVGDTLDAHRVVKLAQSLGMQKSVLEKLYKSYFTDQASLFDRSTLITRAVEAGLDTQTVTTMLGGDDFVEDVHLDQSEAERRGIRGVPYFLFGDQTPLSGGQPEEAFATALAQAWQTSSSISANLTEAEVCGPDGCTVPQSKPL